MSFMQIELTQKGALYTANCARCGASMFTHERAYLDHNERRDAMQDGTLRCDECPRGSANPDTFRACGRQYAARYSAPGYLGCTDWHFGRNKRELVREVRDMYGEE